MNNNDFLTAIEKAKEKLTAANCSEDDLWFSGSLVMLEACLVEVWNTAKKDAIPVEWIVGWLTKQTVPATHTCDDYYAVEMMLDDWEKENGKV